jgi:hypothetical protein
MAKVRLGTVPGSTQDRCPGRRATALGVRQGTLGITPGSEQSRSSGNWARPAAALIFPFSILQFLSVLITPQEEAKLKAWAEASLRLGTEAGRRPWLAPGPTQALALGQSWGWLLGCALGHVFSPTQLNNPITQIDPLTQFDPIQPNNPIDLI